MIRALVVPLPGHETFARTLAAALPGAVAGVSLRRFPDRETLATMSEPAGGRDVVLVATLDRPDEKVVPLVLAAGAARDSGAARVVLVAPYLAYLRQDVAFAPGQGVSARHFARLLSSAFDGVVTADPHLHRLRSLGDVFGVPAQAVATAPALAAWIAREVADPVVVGPDAESAQWAADVARRAACPYVVLEKTRRGDRDVSIRVPGDGALAGRTPVLVDDIVSTGGTLVETVRALRERTGRAPVAVAVHGVLAEDPLARLCEAGGPDARLVTTDTIPNPYAAIGVAHLFGPAVREVLAASAR